MPANPEPSPPEPVAPQPMDPERGTARPSTSRSESARHADLTARPDHPDAERLVGSFPEDAVEGLLAELSARGLQARVDDPQDRTRELQAEMAEEDQAAVAGPGLPVMTKEMLAGAVPGTLIGGVVGAVLLIPAAIPEWGDLSFVARLIWALVIGGLFGSTVGVLLGGILGSRAGNKPMAAQRGRVVSVPEIDQHVRPLLESHRPVRLDRVHRDGTYEVLTTEADSQPGLMARRMGANVRGSDRGDEY